MKLDSIGKVELSELMLLAMLIDLMLKVLENMAFCFLEPGRVWRGHRGT